MPRRDSAKMIQHQVKGIEITPAAGRVNSRQLAVEQERYLLLREPAMRPQWRVKPRQVMPGSARTDHHMTLRHHHDVADAVRGQLEMFGGLGTGEGEGNPWHGTEALHESRNIGASR